ncbi:class I adenylate-forming enzyme family protein [Psychrosphaera sp. 1_MG-2023]|uniref:class I adenylate-forming enzyme family protein n=1 Tax=Psychrosphaera sp. 1_MG-2023 TaxID=3062643 RepID=UPI0026E4102E|nr:class I adenylate-forming enzyme family protein [Psychrosphaera sp. 1_MG-2023]MDO6718395.1 class I adenylate-forming enzyme family protein [Psychrosphaera sp. 1_MG-2023]
MLNLYSEISNSSPEHLAIIGEDKQLTYEQLHNQIASLACKLVSDGVTQGNRVGIHSVSNVNLLISYYACMAVGAVPVPFPFKDEERIAGALETANIQYQIDPTIDIETLPKQENLDLAYYSEAIVIFTSGTTSSKLKGVRLSHEGISSICQFMNDEMEVDANIVECVYAAIDHAYGFGRCHSVFKVGGTVVLPKAIKGFVNLFSLLHKHQCNALAIAPSMLSSILQVAHEHLNELSHQIKWIQTGAMKFDPFFRENLIKSLPTTRIFLHYGLSEAMRVTFFELNRHLDKSHTEGKPSRGCELQILNENNQPLGNNCQGTIAIRGTNLCLGYLDDALWQSNLVDGWYKTSDQGFIDDAGYLVFGGRADDVINCNGALVHPDEIESKLVNLIKTNAFSVVGIPDPKKLKDSIAVVCIEGKSTLSMRDIVDHLKSTDAALIPNQLVHIESLPRTRSGKINRNELTKIISL